MPRIIITDNVEEGIKILKEAGIECYADDALEYGLEYEAEHRLNCYLENDEDAKEKYDKLSDEEKDKILDAIASRYNECGSQIFDYDYMDDIVNEEFLSVLPTEEVEEE